MKHLKKRLLAGVSALAIALALVPASRAAETLTRGQVRDILLSAADDYLGEMEGDLVPDRTAVPTWAEANRMILRGDENGNLYLDRPVTRAEALVMLGRAFGGFEAPVGANARMAFPAGTFTDLPAWAEEELAPVLGTGIVAGTEGQLSPEEPVTAEELETLIRRAYAFKGTNLKDDFYAAVNRE